MNRTPFVLFGLAAISPLIAQNEPAAILPQLTVYSTRVANQEPVGTFAMPVSALRFEPLVDVQTRNLAEGQSDVTIRGGIFENTGFRLGAVALYDPQTGHYFAEIPVAPAMLGAPTVLTGMNNAIRGFNANAGTVSYDWRPIRTAGSLALAGGEYHSDRQEYYQGYTNDLGADAGRLGADVAFAHSRSDGSIPYGDHKFYRYNARLQLVRDNAQTDLFFGYQSKFFGWPNLYTPFNSDETENLQTLLAVLNHRVQFGADEWYQVGAFWRRNKDDYAFNRFAPLGPVHPFQHTTWVYGVALDGRRALPADGWAVAFNAHAMTDGLKSTSLLYGRFKHRDYEKIGVVPEKTWILDATQRVVVKAGANFDDTNRDPAVVSPLFEIAHETKLSSGGVRRFYASYSKSTQAPTYTALNSSATSGLFRGNPDLGRTNSHNLEVGTSTLLGAWRVQAAVFWRRDDGLVDWTFRRGVTARTANAVDIDTTGFEAVVQRSWSVLDLVLGYTALTKDANYGSTSIDASFYALNYPKQRLTAAFVARLGAGFELRLDNEARLQADNILRAPGTSDKAVTSAVGLAYHPPGLRQLGFALQVDNLWNNSFQEVPAVPASKRQATLSVDYTW
jgi:vitamin B12 transporter